MIPEPHLAISSRRLSHPAWGDHLPSKEACQNSVSAITAMYLLGLLLLPFLFVSGCATSTTGLQTPTQKSELAALRRVKVQISGSEKMYLYLHASRGGVAGAVAFGLIGAAVESGVRANEDQKIADTLSPALGDFNVPQRLEQELVHKLSMAKHFDTVAPSRGGEATTAAAQAQILVDLEHWGLYPPVRKDAPEDYVQAGMEATVQIIDLGSGNTLWKSKELYLHGKEHPLSDYQTKRDLLREEMTETVEAMSYRLSTAIRRACR
jgi:hypothetical protein